MQETAEGAAAERVVFAGVENEFVPEVVGRLRRHRDVTLAAHQIGEEELPQAARHQRAVLAGEAWVMLLEPGQQARRPLEGADIFGAPQRLPFAEQHGAANHRGRRQDAEKCRGRSYDHGAPRLSLI